MPAIGLNQEYQHIIDELYKEIETHKAMFEHAADEIAKLQDANARLTQSLKGSTDKLEQSENDRTKMIRQLRWANDWEGRNE